MSLAGEDQVMLNESRAVPRAGGAPLLRGGVVGWFKSAQIFRSRKKAGEAL